ncbi:hypothetical protein CFN78_23285 [Amycolatopsis antarctica]|uniref:Uncharacterized protein n=1 Tax=Amycolatopsis antarctica TaxID=1854586 RepID=A0A263CXH6_9PSEU|nr:hypothetical protein [Amycolatopsis antarctica]OZM70842.1 hypothetical protein CFN78_23285 [Amycolatopsis antarctica]
MGDNGGEQDMTYDDRDVRSADTDPRAKWRELPPRIKPESWTAEQATEPVPGSVEAAEGNRQAREARNVIERGGASF